jgi:flagellar biosynthesis protein FlhF
MIAKTYRARSMHEALELVRRDLGPDAAVLHTRHVRGGLLRWLVGAHQVEVTASADVNVPSRYAAHADVGSLLDAADDDAYCPADRDALVAAGNVPPAHAHSYRDKFRRDLKAPLSDLNSMVEDLCGKSDAGGPHALPQELFQLFTDLIDAEVSEELARELVERVRTDSSGGDLDDPVLLKARITRLVEDEIRVTGPIEVTPGRRRLVALVGPTGVGKTTTIAKLAANFRLRQRRRVGLITVDTYRIAAVEQLRTYADIIDLPMEVVSTPREMREAVDRLSNLDLVLLDTAGRSPRDEVKIQELKSLLAEARPDDVHLVLSSVSSVATLNKTAARFLDVGVTSLLMTKLDEATGLGNLLPLLRSCQVPLSYLTNGQNVPDDIEAADPRKLARMVLGMETGG